MELNNMLYDAVVISDEVDRTLSGAVRVSIIGVTNTLEDDIQPWALPSVSPMMGVPTKGTYLKVYFENNDVHQPVYLQFSPQKAYLPPDFISNYPNTSVANLGSDFFQKVHDRLNKTTTIDHDSQATAIWTALGGITLDTPKAYTNTGYGANKNNGNKLQNVITAGNIDLFSCTPMDGGSEYLQIPHVSIASVTGALDTQQQLAQPTSITEGDDTGEDAPVTRPLLNGNTVEYLQAKTILTIPNRKIKIILIGNTGNNDFTNSMNALLTTTNSVHYVVGSNLTDFIQMIDLQYAGTYGSKGTWNKEVNINRIAVSISLCGDGKSAFSSDQYTNVNNIIAYVRQQHGKEIEVVTIADVDPGLINMFGTAFDKTKVTA